MGADRLFQLDGKVALVTGGASGIGAAIARDLAQSGAHVVIADLRGAEDAAGRLRAQGLGATGLALDVADEDRVAAAAQAVETDTGGIDILVNNAGIYASLEPKPFDDLSVAEWRAVLDVNVIGLFLCTRSFVPQMERRGGGRIVNIGSGTPYKGIPFLLHYVASKGAVLGITRALARELAPRGIRVNAVAPGFTLSEGVQANPVQMSRLRDVSREARAIRRDQMPDDVVGAVRFLASDASAFMTGQTLVVDGGGYFT